MGLQFFLQLVFVKIQSGNTWNILQMNFWFTLLDIFSVWSLISHCIKEIYVHRYSKENIRSNQNSIEKYNFACVRSWRTHIFFESKGKNYLPSIQFSSASWKIKTKNYFPGFICIKLENIWCVWLIIVFFYFLFILLLVARPL